MSRISSLEWSEAVSNGLKISGRALEMNNGPLKGIPAVQPNAANIEIYVEIKPGQVVLLFS